MPRDEALALVQILLGLLLFTVGILPALLIQLNVEEPIRRVFHKRIRTAPMLAVGVCTLILVGTIINSPVHLVIVSGAFTQLLARAATTVTIALFVLIWYHIYTHVTVRFLVNDIAGEIVRTFKKRGATGVSGVDDLLRLGESLKDGEKDLTIEAIGNVCRSIQGRPDYDGAQLDELLRGLQRIVVRNGTVEHHRRALAVVGNVRKTLVQQNLADDYDAKVLREVIGVLGCQALSQQMESTAMYWMAALPDDIDVPHRIGTAGARTGYYRVAIEALSRLARIPGEQKSLPKELMAVVAHLHAAGPSVGITTIAFLNRRGYLSGEIRTAAEGAAAAFKDMGDYATADVLREFLRDFR